MKENASLRNIQISAHMKLFWSMCLLFKQDGDCMGPVEMWEMMLLKNLKVSWDGHPRCTSFFAFPPGNRTNGVSTWETLLCTVIREIPSTTRCRGTLAYGLNWCPGYVWSPGGLLAEVKKKKKKKEMVSWSEFYTIDWAQSAKYKKAAVATVPRCHSGGYHCPEEYTMVTYTPYMAMSGRQGTQKAVPKA